MAERDYIREMDEHINAILDEDSWVAPAAAAQLHARLTETDPDLLEGWLRISATALLADAIRTRNRFRRMAYRRAADAHEFQEAAAAHGDGDDSGLSVFVRLSFQINDQGQFMHLGAMRGSDHIYVANNYEEDERKARMAKEFHRAVAKKCGKRRTDEVFTEETYLRLLRSITDAA